MERLQEPGRNGHVDVQVADGEAVAKQTNKQFCYAYTVENAAKFYSTLIKFT
jgi:predicted methyltransferase MtxX (methanogen marker protein 4)